MIKKETVDIKELNRKIHSMAQMKPSLDSFPIKDIEKPYNSMDLFKTDNIVGAQIKEINNFKKPNENLKLNILPEIKNNTESLNTESLNTESLDTESLNTESLDTESLDTESLNTESLNTESLNTESLNTESLDTESLNTESLDTESLNTESLDTESKNNNKLIRSIMDIKRNTILDKGIILIFIIIMGILIYFGVHKNI